MKSNTNQHIESTNIISDPKERFSIKKLLLVCVLLIGLIFTICVIFRSGVNTFTESNESNKSVATTTEGQLYIDTQKKAEECIVSQSKKPSTYYSTWRLDCLNEDEILLVDYSICGKIFERAYRNKCIRSLAAEKSDFSACTTYNLDVRECIMSVASLVSEENRCLTLNEVSKKQCLSVIRMERIISARNPSLCYADGMHGYYCEQSYYQRLIYELNNESMDGWYKYDLGKGFSVMLPPGLAHWRDSDSLFIDALNISISFQNWENKLGKIAPGRYAYYAEPYTDSTWSELLSLKDACSEKSRNYSSIRSIPHMKNITRVGIRSEEALLYPINNTEFLLVQYGEGDRDSYWYEMQEKIIKSITYEGELHAVCDM